MLKFLKQLITQFVFFAPFRLYRFFCFQYFYFDFVSMYLYKMSNKFFFNKHYLKNPLGRS